MANQADFAPTLGALKDLRPFVFWAQTTLPTVFDDSLSYYEVLTKLCKMVNTMLENEDTNAENITALATAYQELQDFTNNYFENLDVTKEISDKLDEMFNSGELGQIAVESASEILNKYLYGEDGESGKNKDINDMIAAANDRIDAEIRELDESSSEILGNLQTSVDAGIRNIPNVIEGWMDENLTIPSDIIIDDTLSIKDAAAEAYATGQLMDEVENLVLATSYWQNLNVDRAAQNYIIADIADGGNPSVHTGAPAKTMVIANVVEGETVVISGVASAYSNSQYIPAFALCNLTLDTGGNPYYEIKSVYPEGWDIDPEHPTGSNFKIVRNHTVHIPVTGDTFPINCVLIMEDATIPLSAKCSRLNMRTDNTLTSQSIPAQGKATGDALDTKIPWPVSEGSKDLGTDGYGLVTNADGTTRWERIGADNTAVNTKLEYAQDIPSNTDYDTLLTCGNYVCKSGAIAATLTNCPTTSAHRLFVFEMHADRRIMQSVLCSGTTCKEYRRYYNGNSFSDWIIASGAEPSDDIIRMVSSYANYQMDVSGLLPLVWYRGNIDTSGMQQASTKGLITYFIPIAPSASIKYKKLDTVNTLTIAEYGPNKEYLKRATLRAVNTKYTVGDNCHFIRFYYDSSSVLYPEFAYFNFVAYLSESTEEMLPIGLHTMPKNQGVLNCIKRARQMTDINWAPAVDIDRVNIVSGQKYDETHNYFQNIFAANREYSGLPYSSRNFIGTRKGITQFVTSAANEASLECTDSQYAGNPSTASYYGTVCVTLVSYALHAPQLNSPSYNNLVGLTKLYDLYSGGAYHDIDDLELCDILWEHGHVAIVTDIIHDQLGHVVSVEVSEATKFGSYLTANGNDNYGGKCRRKIWTKDEFLNWFVSFGVYRYDNELLSKIPYEPNKFVPMADEPPYVAQAGLPCIPVEGDHAYYYLSTPSQRNVRVLIRDTGYTHLRVKQNGENFALLPVAGLTEITVTCDSSKEAIYEAYLCNEQETMTSASCSWLMLASIASAEMTANADGSYTFSVVRQTNSAYPFVVVYNGTSVNNGDYSPITNYAVVSVSGGYRYTFTATPPEGITEITTFSLLFDGGEFGWFPTSAIRP